MNVGTFKLRDQVYRLVQARLAEAEAATGGRVPAGHTQIRGALT